MVSKIPSTEVKKLKGKYKWYFSGIKGNNIDAADAITSETAKNYTNNVFRKKQRTKNVLPNKFAGFELKGKVKLMFGKTKDSMKRKCYVFSSYKQRNKVFLLYSEGKLQQDRYGWCISIWNVRKR